MQRFIAALVILALLSAGLEFVGDYSEVIEQTALAGVPEGHYPDDGHTPAEHGIACDICHFGGVHLTGIVMPVLAHVLPAGTADTPWTAIPPALVPLGPGLRPPIA